MIPGQCLYAPVIGSLCFLGKKAARDTLVVVPVMCHTFTAFSMSGAVVGAGTVPLVVAVLCHILLSFHSANQARPSSQATKSSVEQVKAIST